VAFTTGGHSMRTGFRHLLGLTLIVLALGACAVVKDDYAYLSDRAAYGPGGGTRD
jgi:hypothetical protein